jgi:hypothetical protein
MKKLIRLVSFSVFVYMYMCLYVYIFFVRALRALEFTRNKLLLLLLLQTALDEAHIYQFIIIGRSVTFANEYYNVTIYN